MCHIGDQYNYKKERSDHGTSETELRRLADVPSRAHFDFLAAISLLKVEETTTKAMEATAD